MTKREFYAVVMKMDGVTEEMKAICEQGILSLDKELEGARKRAAKRNEEKSGIRSEVLGILTMKPQTAAQIAAQIEGLKSRSVPSLLKPFVDDGTVVKSDVKNENGSKIKAYALAEEVEG